MLTLFFSQHSLAQNGLFSPKLCGRELSTPVGAGITLCDQYGGEEADLVIGSDPTSPMTTDLSDASSLIALLGTNNVSNLHFRLKGIFWVDVPLLFTDCIVEADTGAQIVVHSDFTAVGSKFFACECFWKGILVNNIFQTSSLSLTGCRLEDGNPAVSLLSDGAGIIINSTTFDRNVDGIYCEGGLPLSVPINLSDFNNNNFTCSSDLNACNGHFPHGKISHAGISANMATVTIGTSKTTNAGVFSNMRYGITTDRSNMTVRGKCTFYGMTYTCSQPYDGYGIFADNLSTLTVGGLQKSTFSDNFGGGIRTLASSLTVTSCGFYDNYEAIRSDENNFGQLVRILQNTIELGALSRNGIYVDRPNSMSSAPPRVHVSFNTIRRLEPTQIGDVAASIWGIKVECSKFQTIDDCILFRNLYDDYSSSNADSVLQDFAIIAQSKLPGSIGAGNGLKMTDNRVWYYAPEGHEGKIGIAVADLPSSHSIQIRQNKVKSIAPKEGSLASQGFIFYKVQDPCIINNEVDKLQQGFSFFDDCDRTQFKINRIGEAGSSGLLLQDAWIGLQERFGNTWNTDPNAYGFVAAQCHPDFFKFRSPYICESTDLAIKPVNIIPADWFDYDPGATNYGCVSTGMANFSVTDEDLLAGNLDTASFSAPRRWDMQFRMLSRLIQNPQLLSGNANANSFFNQHINTAVGQFASIALAIGNAWNNTSPSTTTKIIDKEAFEADLYDVDSLLTLLPTSPTLWAQREALVDTIHILGKAIAEASVLTKQDRAATFQTLRSQLLAVPVTAPYESNYQIVMAILLARAFEEPLTNADRTALAAIAAQDPAVGGSFVVFAQDLLRDCGSQKPSDANEVNKTDDVNEHGSEFSIYPNPTNDLLTVTFPNSEGLWFIQNANGITMLQGKASNLSNGQVDTSQLPSGVYFLVFKSVDGSIQSKRFGIVKH